MLVIVGLLLAIGSLIASVIHLEQSFASYYDFVGVVMVIGGTAATAAMTLPWDQHKEILGRVLELFYRPFPDNKRLVQSCMLVQENVLKGVFNFDIPGKGFAYNILRDGVELIQLGFTVDKIEAVLGERVFQSTERTRNIGSAIRGLAKYPPAFGLAGTVLGLVHLMRGVSDGMSPKETGIRMAIALVATFYGLLAANLIVSPAGEAVSKNALEEEKLGQIALQAILLAAGRANLLEAQEMLNSFVNESDRIDILGLGGPGGEEGAGANPGGSPSADQTAA
jgi:chemotaxis protein MotA